MGTRLASLLCNNGIVDFIELSRDYSIVEIKTPDKWIGLSILDLRIREKFGVNIVAIKNNNEQININPRPEEILEKNSSMVVIGTDIELQKVSKL